MPHYDYRCAQCAGEQRDVFQHMSECKTNAPECCGSKMEILITAAPYGFVDREIHYKCPVTNQGVTSRKQRNEIMAREGLVDANDLVNHKTIAARRKQHEEMQALVEKHRGPKEVEDQVLKWATS